MKKVFLILASSFVLAVTSCNLGNDSEPVTPPVTHCNSSITGTILVTSIQGGCTYLQLDQPIRFPLNDHTSAMGDKFILGHTPDGYALPVQNGPQTASQRVKVELNIDASSAGIVCPGATYVANVSCVENI